MCHFRTGSHGKQFIGKISQIVFISSSSASLLNCRQYFAISPLQSASLHAQSLPHYGCLSCLPFAQPVVDAFICNEMRSHQTLHNTFIFLTVRYTFNIKANYRLFYLRVCVWGEPKCPIYVCVPECVCVVGLRPFFGTFFKRAGTNLNDMQIKTWLPKKNVRNLIMCMCVYVCVCMCMCVCEAL